MNIKRVNYIQKLAKFHHNIDEKISTNAHYGINITNKTISQLIKCYKLN